jgi:hypothetical protein
MAKTDPLDTFGRFLMEHLRDSAHDHLDGLLVGHWKAPSLKQLQRDLRKLTAAERSIVKRALASAIDSAIHDFLFAIQESHDEDGAVAVKVDGKDLADLSDGLQGELSTDKGWFARFSKHGKQGDEA